MYPTKDYFRTNVTGSGSQDHHMRLESGLLAPAKKQAINFENLSKEEAFGVF